MPDSLARRSFGSLSSKMTLPEVFELVSEDLLEIEERIGALQRPDIPLSAEIADHVLAMRGKRVRPLLLLLVSRLGGRAERDSVLWSATVTELVHTATLLHDDCLDGTETRRGVPTVNHRWGQHAAILMGDWLFTKGFDLLCEHRLHDALHILVQHTHRMTTGMNRELASRHDAELPVDEYLRVIDEKTGALFVASCEIGALLGGLGEGESAGMSEFGRDLGYAFQIIDDIFDFTGDPSDLGKPVGTDFRLGFATLPLLYAWEEGDPAVGARVAEWFRGGALAAGQWEIVRDFVRDSGGIERARQDALAFAYSARDRLAALNGNDGVAPLLATVEYIIARGR
jgi:octaprenyl-diphosphate synthase